MCVILQPPCITHVYTTYKASTNRECLWKVTAEQAITLQKPSAATLPLLSTLKRLSANGVQKTLNHKLMVSWTTGKLQVKNNNSSRSSSSNCTFSSSMTEV